jgi:hypothetical protein
MHSSRQRISQMCTLWRLTPVPFRDLGHWSAGHDTARYLCSVTLNSHNMNGSVKHQTKPMCKESSGTARWTTLAEFLVVTTFSTASRAHLRRAGPNGPGREQREASASSREGKSGQGDPP